MIGRERELRLVDAFLDSAGSGTHALLLEGEAGIGKSTVWQAAVDAAAARGYRLALTQPTEAESRIPFAGLNDLFGDLADARVLELPAPQRAALDVALMRASPDAEPIQPLALSLAVLELMRLASSGMPFAVAVDDVQWLDDSTAAVVRFALRRLDGERVIVIAAERTDSPGEVPAILADVPADRITRTSVAPLDTDGIDRLLDDVLGLRLAPTQVKRVHRQAGGNPFFALEIGRALVTRGGDAVGDVPIPESLGGLLRTRLGALSPEAREVIRAVAVLAQPTSALIEAAIGRQPAHDGLRAAREAQVLASDDEPIRFTHPLLATATIAELDDDERRTLYRRLSDVAPEAEERARLLALAATGPDEDVASALDAAAEGVHRRGAPDASAELAELAAGLTAESDPLRAHRMAVAGRYRLMAGDAAGARALLERALEEPAANDGPARAEVLFRLAGVRQLMDDFAAAETLARDALGHVGGDVALTVHVKLLLAGISFITGRHWSEGARHAAEAKERAEELGDPKLVAATIGPFVHWQYATGHGFDRTLIRLAEELEPWTAQFRTLDLPVYDIARIEIVEGSTASGYARLRTLVERAEREGDYSSLPFLLGTMALGDFLDGDRDTANARIALAARLGHATGQSTAQVHTRHHEAQLAARLGDADRALAAGRDAFELMTKTGWRVGEWGMRADLALLELSRGQSAAALGLVSDALRAPRPDEPDRRRWAEGAAIEALLGLGRHEEAGEALVDFERPAANEGFARLRADANRARARYLAAMGDTDGADAAIAEAEAIHRRMEDRWELARTLLAAGEIHRRARRRARARTALREALELFTFLGARLWAKQARQQLARVDTARAPGEGRGPGELTPTQRRVAELVASGLTNRQVADQLFMSPHTVDAHLKAIYQSLGINSRAELRSALSP